VVWCEVHSALHLITPVSIMPPTTTLAIRDSLREQIRDTRHEHCGPCRRRGPAELTIALAL
jgi:hypothetical protein